MTKAPITFNLATTQDGIDSKTLPEYIEYLKKELYKSFEAGLLNTKEEHKHLYEKGYIIL